APELDLEKEKAVQKVVYEAIQAGLVNSAHDCSEGGLAVALAECCISDEGNMIGAQISLGLSLSDKALGTKSNIESLISNLRPDAFLFSESQSRIIISCPKASAPKIEALAKQNKVSCYRVGEVGGDSLKIDNLIDLPLSKLNHAWRTSLTV
ncbi:MAG: phosphoribosylformylglycinamidine synthase II, partial [Candidatus Saganbacteria bacterium]|nr:phosphoribosylformylglycinamidine synthase II [Candidatus Saganbacteria bacterium]